MGVLYSEVGTQVARAGSLEVVCPIDAIFQPKSGTGVIVISPIALAAESMRLPVSVMILEHAMHFI